MQNPAGAWRELAFDGEILLMQEVHIRFALFPLNCTLFGEQESHTHLPHFRQWCLRNAHVNSTWH